MKKFNGTISRSGALYYVNVEWCGHCKRTRPVMEKLANELGQAVDVFDVDGDMWSDYLQRVLGPAAPRFLPHNSVYPQRRRVRIRRRPGD